VSTVVVANIFLIFSGRRRQLGRTISIPNSRRLGRDEFLSQTDWTQTEDCPLDLHMKEKCKAYRKYLRDFPGTYDPEIDEIGEAVEDFNLPE